MVTDSVLAIFVKTPELSSVKTRLAAHLGEERTLQFYDLAIKATAALALKVKMQIPNLDVVWAVAEKEATGIERWKQFPTIYQGEGDLGQRLNHVYQSLILKYETVSFLGADSPHLHWRHLTQALQATFVNKDNGFVLGETEDGGFYYFGGGKALPKETWTSVEYSKESTAKQLAEGLKRSGHIEFIEMYFDIDVIEDLERLLKLEFRELPEQTALFEWAVAHL